MTLAGVGLFLAFRQENASQAYSAQAIRQQGRKARGCSTRRQGRLQTPGRR